MIVLLSGDLHPTSAMFSGVVRCGSEEKEDFRGPQSGWTWAKKTRRESMGANLKVKRALGAVCRSSGGPRGDDSTLCPTYRVPKEVGRGGLSLTYFVDLICRGGEHLDRKPFRLLNMAFARRRSRVGVVPHYGVDDRRDFVIALREASFLRERGRAQHHHSRMDETQH